MHIHTFRVFHTSPPSATMVVECEGCEGEFRLANGVEANAISAGDLFDTGALLGPTNMIIVPKEWSLSQ